MIYFFKICFGRKKSLIAGEGFVRGVTTLTNVVSGQSQNCSGNLEISLGVGTLGNFSGKHAIIPGQCRKNRDIEKFYFTCSFKIREDDPNFLDDLS